MASDDDRPRRETHDVVDQHHDRDARGAEAGMHDVGDDRGERPGVRAGQRDRADQCRAVGTEAVAASQVGGNPGHESGQREAGQAAAKPRQQGGTHREELAHHLEDAHAAGRPVMRRVVRSQCHRRVVAHEQRIRDDHDERCDAHQQERGAPAVV
jgi:hypothetical protein